MSQRFISARLGRGIDRQRNLAAVRRDVVMLGGRVPGLQRDAGSGQQIRATAGGDVAGEDVRLAPVGQPVIPEAVFAALGDVRLDLRVPLLLVALRLRRFARQVGPHPRHERDSLAVGKPFDRDWHPSAGS